MNSDVGAVGSALARRMTEPSDELPVTRQTVARHLTALRRVGLLDGSRHGRERLWGRSPDRLDQVSEALGGAALRRMSFRSPRLENPAVRIRRPVFGSARRLSR